MQLSNIYSHLRGDATGTKNEDSAQGFVRSTTKYWVRARAPARSRSTQLFLCATCPQPACLSLTRAHAQQQRVRPPCRRAHQ